jgi:eukaryotic-like serine/threonine-protein kinase
MTSDDDDTRPLTALDEHPTRPVGPDAPAAPPPLLGTFADDFDLIRELGRGAFARVYLARQRSLGRLVAVKVSDRPGGGEGTVLASLEHPHVVRVFAEATDRATGQSGLILQYVSGAHLGEVLADVFRDARKPAGGEGLLAAVDRRAFDPVPFDPSALADRDLYRGGYAAVVCRLGAKLADALSLAHGRNILHCDIKPSNVLLDRYGRPLLADFNVAVHLPADGGAAPVGGTLAYMAPEQLAAFGGIADQPPVDRRSDLYALGLVLAEALTGRPPPAFDPSADGMVLVLGLWEQRRAEPDDWLGVYRPLIPTAVWRVLRRCLAFDPAGRYGSAAELAAALRGAADQLDRQAAVPAPNRVGRAVERFPLLALAALTFLPHLIGSAVNVAYNRAAMPPTDTDQARFLAVTAGYNLLVYPLCVAAAVLVAWPLVRCFWHPGPECEEPAALDRLRRRAVRLGRWGAVLAAVGWFPGGVAFPLALTDWDAGVNWTRFGHFAASFAVSGLIAMTYSHLGIQAVVVRAFLPRLMHPEQTPTQRRADAHLLVGDLGVTPLVAAAVPLTAAVVQLVFAPADLTPGFRVLVTALILIGMFGLGVAIAATRRLQKVVTVLTGAGA